MYLHCRICKFNDAKMNGTVQMCGYCEEPVSGEGLFACGKSWHKDCFVCADCHCNLLEAGTAVILPVLVSLRTRTSVHTLCSILSFIAMMIM